VRYFLFDLAPKSVRKKGDRSSLISRSFTLSLSFTLSRGAELKATWIKMLKSNRNNAREKISTVRGVSLQKRNRHSREYRRGKNVEQFGPKRFEENIPRGRVHDRDAIVVRVQILERNRETDRKRVEPGENED